MGNSFLVIAITTPVILPGEEDRINQILLDNEADFVHIRKPNSTADEIENLIKKINPKFHERLKLHDHFELLDFYSLGGIHLNSRNTEIYSKAKSVSISLHSLEEIEGKEIYDYFFISPVFDSLSKAGYKARFDLSKLSDKIRGKKAIALGGVTPSKFKILQTFGFYGAALLGYFFPNKN